MLNVQPHLESEGFHILSFSSPSTCIQEQRNYSVGADLGHRFSGKLFQEAKNITRELRGVAGNEERKKDK